MNSKLATSVLLLLIAAGALAFRLPRLDVRPMHADEAVHAARFRDLWQQGRYEYRPEEFHGPTLNFSTLPVAWLGPARRFAETTEATYRIVPVIYGAALVLLLWLLADGLGRPAAVCAAVLCAVSPAMVFYSRYYIQETLLVFFTLGAIGCGWRYYRSGKLAWCLLAGVALGLMQATKETSVIAYGCLAAAAALTLLWGKIVDREPLVRPAPSCRPIHFGIGLGVALFTAALLLTTFLTNLHGLPDAVRTYLPWLHRAGGGSVHVHPWYYYLELLGWCHRTQIPGLGQRAPVWTEAAVLGLAAIGIVASLWPDGRGVPDARAPLVRLLAFYGLLMTAAYSAIPYKTPWCLLSFHNALIVMAGVGAVAMVRWIGRPNVALRVVLGCGLLAAAGHLAWQAYRASYVDCAEIHNPYVYAQTSRGMLQLQAKLEELAAASPMGYDVPIKVIAKDEYFWPLPWYLRRFDRRQVVYGSEIPADVGAPIVITVPEHDAAIDALLRDTHRMTGYYELRPQKLLLLFVRDDVWEAHLPHGPTAP